MPSSLSRESLAKREKGKVMTREELAAIKASIANGEVEEVPEVVEAPAAEAPGSRQDDGGGCSGEGAAQEASRKGGAPLTKEEWDEIRRERQKERMRQRQLLGDGGGNASSEGASPR